jgi:hypothetical protein
LRYVVSPSIVSESRIPTMAASVGMSRVRAGGPCGRAARHEHELVLAGAHGVGGRERLAGRLPVGAAGPADEDLRGPQRLVLDGRDGLADHPADVHHATSM